MNKFWMGVIGVAIAVGASPVGAVQVTSVPDQQFSQEPNATTINFDLGVPTSGLAIYSGDIETLGPESVIGIANNSSRYLAIGWNGGKRIDIPNQVVINFAKPLNYFGLYWGSIDPYNTIEFYNDRALIASFMGSQLTSVPASWTAPSSNFYVNFWAETADFNTVILTSTYTFESDNHAYRVAEVIPESSTNVGLVAFGIFGASLVLRQKQQQRP